MCPILRSLLLPFLITSITIAQAPKKYSSSDIYLDIQKLNFLGRVLYIAAHPDDENTKLISYLENQLKAETAYLSLTRGDGGQNLIGTELSELLGVLRTQELLAARRIDGGEQFFTRAKDFGFSKHPKETLKIWDKHLVLSDVVWIIRNFKPDVIINRFDHRTPGSTHGHHTSSAMLSFEAFDLANDAKAFADQLSQTTTWQSKKLFFNTSWWFYGSQENFDNADKTNLLALNVGMYYPNLGLSNNEIASMASSQHLCQGFGRLTTRGTETEYIELLKGELPNDKTTIFDGINTTWSRMEGGKAIGDILYKIEADFNFKNPAIHLPELLKAYELLQKNSDARWKLSKTNELLQIIEVVSGLYLEATAEAASAHPSENLKAAIEVINRSKHAIYLKAVSLSPKFTTDSTVTLTENTKFNFSRDLNISQDALYTSPYWLREKGTLGNYIVKDQDLIGKPETPRANYAYFKLDFEGTLITIRKPIIYRYAKPDKGELYQPFDILPEATVRIKDKVLIFADGSSKEVPVVVKAHKDNANGEVKFSHTKAWKVDAETKAFNIEKKGDEQTLIFSLSPPADEDDSFVTPIIKIDGKEISKELTTIAYDHIPQQSVLMPSETKVVRLNIKKVGQYIGYIAGAGDNIPLSLEQMGYTVEIIDPATITATSLKKYDAIVMGIRAYNVVSELKFKQKNLLDYVENGGTLIVQYNTAGRRDKPFDNIAPYHLKLSNDRVTDENAEVTILAKNHSLVTYPNTITSKDFEGWIQERGLYFPEEWADEFTPILEMHDEDESSKSGSLLVATYGKGHYIYTGLSFFRELPAGVSGAYKLFANMLSIGKKPL